MSKRYGEPLLDRGDYFNTWNPDELKYLKEHHKELIYAEYRTKHIVFNRDNYTCQVEGCKFTDSKPTLHHYKHKANDGHTKPRNCVTVCYAHQKLYHSGRMALKFKNSETLPPHIRGHIQAHHWFVNGRPRREFNYKKIKKKMKSLRKEHREDWGRPISVETILALLLWLFGPVETFIY